MGIWLINNLDSLHEWHPDKSLLVGPDASARTVAGVAIEDDTGLRVRVDIPAAEECRAFQEARLIGAKAYIGFGSRLFVVDLHSLQYAMYAMDGYFGHLYSSEDFESLDEACSVLVSSASEVLAFGRKGTLIWKTNGLGIDGVTLHEASGGMLRGDGEWDPPGGWQPFVLSQATGEIISDPLS